MALSTVSRWLRRIGLGKLSRLEPPEPANRYERKRPASSIHVDVKKLGRISVRGAGHRIAGTERASTRSGPGGSARPAGSSSTSASTTPPASPTPRCSPTRRADRRRLSQAGGRMVLTMGITVERVMSTTAPATARPCTPRPAASSDSGTYGPSPYRPRTNGKAERFIQTLHPPLGPRGPLRHLRRTHRRPSRLAHALQLQPTPRLPRPQAARSSARRAGTTSWVTTASRRAADPGPVPADPAQEAGEPPFARAAASAGSLIGQSPSRGGPSARSSQISRQYG